LSGDLDDLTERQDRCSEPRCRAALAASHVKLCLHKKTPLWPFWWLLAACAMADFAVIGLLDKLNVYKCPIGSGVPSWLRSTVTSAGGRMNFVEVKANACVPREIFG
jgi:hypothetical protein